MNDQPNRRTDIATYEAMQERGKAMFLDGIIEGLPLAKNVKLIVEEAVLFGRDLANQSDTFHATVRYDNITDLTRDTVRNTVNRMFGGVYMNEIAREIVDVGVAYGFRNEKQHKKYSAIEAMQAKIIAENEAGEFPGCHQGRIDLVGIPRRG